MFSTRGGSWISEPALGINKSLAACHWRRPFHQTFQGDQKWNNLTRHYFSSSEGKILSQVEIGRTFQENATL